MGQLRIFALCSPALLVLGTLALTPYRYGRARLLLVIKTVLPTSTVHLYGNYLVKQLTNIAVVLQNAIERSLLGRVRKKGELVHLFRFSGSFLLENSRGD